MSAASVEAHFLTLLFKSSGGSLFINSSIPLIDVTLLFVLIYLSVAQSQSNICSNFCTNCPVFELRILKACCDKPSVSLTMADSPSLTRTPHPIWGPTCNAHSICTHHSYLLPNILPDVPQCAGAQPRSGFPKCHCRTSTNIETSDPSFPSNFQHFQVSQLKWHLLGYPSFPAPLAVVAFNRGRVFGWDASLSISGCCLSPSLCPSSIWHWFAQERGA
jgi:hypothetical protein